MNTVVASKPKYFRTIRKREAKLYLDIGWEIYNRHLFFIDLWIGSCNFSINKWKK